MSIRHGTPLPKKIENAPELWYGLEFYMIAFFRLSSGRSSGFKACRISWVQIENYCDMLEIFGSQREIMHYHIGALDSVFMKFQESKDK